MNGVIEALHIYEEHTPILSHTYTSRPLSASHLLPLYLDHPAPRPHLIYLRSTNPPTLVFSLTHAHLLFLLTTSSDIEPLLALEFLHRVIDVLEEFLGAPLLAAKIEAGHDVAAQLLTEMCDAGVVSTTEPNALRDLVEVEGFMGKLLGGLSLPGKLPPVVVGGSNASSSSSLVTQIVPPAASASPALPWRRANVRHTSNEIYADLVETLAVTLAPSGRPLAAFAHGTMAMTCKVSGVPDMVVTLAGPSGTVGGRHGLDGVIDLPVFHPCVRLARWKERPGELSFVPPDGRFILAGYEVDLLPSDGKSGGPAGASSLRLPVGIEVRTGLGAAGLDFEVKLWVERFFASSSAGTGASGAQAGTPAAPLLQDVSVSVPLPAGVRNLSDMRPTKGDATYGPGDRALEWHIPNKELAAGTSHFGLRCTVVGTSPAVDDADADADPAGLGLGPAEHAYEYHADEASDKHKEKEKETAAPARLDHDRGEKRAALHRTLMPGSAAVSFAVKGWLPSGVRVESIVLDPRKSRGLGETVKPYKGVKYLAVSKGGVEIRC